MTGNGNPFGQPNPGAGVPTTAAQPANPFDNGNPFQRSPSRFKQIGIGVLTNAGKALQPLFAPQQILFGAIGSLTDLSMGRVDRATETWNRALGAAGDYLTYGLTARENPVRIGVGPLSVRIGDGQDARKTYVSGYDLAMRSGVPKPIARTIGLAADFFLDVPLLTKTTKIGRAFGVTTDLENVASANMARAFRDSRGNWDAPAIRKFAGRVAAAPFSTAPIRDVVIGLPAGYRESLAKRAAGMIEGARTVRVQAGREGSRADQLGPTLANFLISKSGAVRGLPTMDGRAIADLKKGNLTGTGIAERLQHDLFVRDSEMASIHMRATEAQNKYAALTERMPAAAKAEFDRIANGILDWKDPADLGRAKYELGRFALGQGTGFHARAVDALWTAASLDTYMGLLKFKSFTATSEKVAGNYMGLRRLERELYGQAFTPNPMAADIAAAARIARGSGNTYQLPEQALHFRRSFGLFMQPEDAIDAVRAAARPPEILNVNDALLSRAIQSAGEKRIFGQPKLTPAQRSAALTANATRAQQFATDFKAFWNDPKKNEETAFREFLTQQGVGNKEMARILEEIGGRWHQNGVLYRPAHTEVEKIIRDMVEDTRSPLGAGASGAEMATNRAVLAARQDLPEWLRESMQQTYDVGELLDQTVKLGAKQFRNRTAVQSVYSFLRDEGGMLKSDDFVKLGIQHHNWRRVNKDLAAKLKAMEGGGSFGDLPFKGDEYIPAAYHDLLVGFTRMDDSPMKNALAQWAITSWKAHKVASPAAIVRDTASNYRFASDMGIDPVSLTRSIVAGITLRESAMRRGDGVLDEVARINHNGTEITWKEIVEQGGFLHGSFVQTEVQDAFKALRQNVASSRGDPFQAMTAGLIDFATQVREKRNLAGGMSETASDASLMARGGVDVLTGMGGPVTAMLTDVKGSIDTMFKLGVYIHMRSKGKDAELAARHADEMFFNYQNQPIMVDFLRKTGVSPFAAFQFMSAGRFMRTLYENPYAVSRWYKLPQSMSQGDERTQGELKNAAPDYMRKQLWIPLFMPSGTKRDSQQRSMFFNLASIMPETSLFSMTGTDAISQWTPPAIELWMQIKSGQGYQGMPLYQGGGTLDEVLRTGNTLEAARGVVKALHQFGASPWAPGSPQAERMAKSIVAATVPADQIMDNKAVQAMLKLNKEGVFAAPLAPGRIAPTRLGGTAPLDPGYAIGRAFGATTAPVTGFADRPGSALGNIQGAKYDISAIKDAMYAEIKDAGGDDAAIDEILARYMPLIDKKLDKLDEKVQWMDETSPLYQLENRR